MLSRASAIALDVSSFGADSVPARPRPQTPAVVGADMTGDASQDEEKALSVIFHYDF
jgi:hypothetical protein